MSERTEPEAPIALLLSDDLMFSSRITGTARALGLIVRPTRSVEVLEKLAQQLGPHCVLVDLANPGLVLPELMRRLRAIGSPMPRVVAYGSHVDAAGLQAARDVGCDPVLPRSKFVEELPIALPQWLGRSG